MMSKPTLETILSHRSIRKFTEQPISEDLFQTLIQAGQQASTSNHLQCVRYRVWHMLPNVRSS